MLREIRAKLVLIILLFSLILSATLIMKPNKVYATGTTYYVDSIGGDDFNSGTSSDSAWKNISKVNEIIFQPGDRILLKAGSEWTGQFSPQGSGIAGNPIVVTMYGIGDKPKLHGGGMVGKGVVYLYNQSYWEISNLDIDNDALSGADRRGVLIEANNAGVINHIYLKNLDVHNIKGTAGNSMSNKQTGGIVFWVTDASSIATRFHDVLVDGCNIYSVDNIGISTLTYLNLDTSPIYPGGTGWDDVKFTDFVIQNNVLHDIGKNSIIVRLLDGGIVQNNVSYNTAVRAGSGNQIFTRTCYRTVVQYNEGFLNNGSSTIDGCAFDADLESPETVWQYNYSHDNKMGLMTFCTTSRDTNVIVRYNISRNDRGRLLNLVYPIGSASIYNNTFYIPSHLSPIIIFEKNAQQEYSFYNNIIYNESPTATYGFDTKGTHIRTFDYNVFYGEHPINEPADPHKLTENPMFINPGSGGIGRDTLSGYRLKTGSPCLNSGFIMNNHGGLDFWGNPIISDKAPNRGAYGGSGIEVVPTLIPQERTINPVADAYVRDGIYANANYGVEDTLEAKDGTAAGYTREIYLKFILPEDTALMTSGKLRIFGFNQQDLETVALGCYSVEEDSWGENEITWNNRPGTKAILSNHYVDSNKKYVEFDVTNFVQGEGIGDGIVTLVLKQNVDENKQLMFHSRENLENQPQLIISQ